MAVTRPTSTPLSTKNRSQSNEVMKAPLKQPRSWARVVEDNERRSKVIMVEFIPQQIGSTVVHITKAECNEGMQKWQNSLVGITIPW